ncbi:MAG: helix-turn-helix transcriptional regulator [Gemmatimonadota bacterium]
MIRTDAEYQNAVGRLARDREVIELQRAKLIEMGLPPEQVEYAMQPALSFRAQLQEEADAYERMRRGDLGLVSDLTSIGRVLIGLRIASGFTQKALAETLGVSESVVSRDERNEYNGISVERAQRIIDALNGSVRLKVKVKRKPVAV